MKYRSDIDGLRALAILPVLAFHAKIPGFLGGFIGVDIFFVISGFLITKIISDEISSGNFSFAVFYKRRILRILPALVVVMLTTIAVGYFMLFPSEFKELGTSVTSASLFASNLFFLSQAGYFEGPAELKPLLHTWSLAVEEQFYLFFPLVLIFLVKIRKFRVDQIILVAAILSFLLSAFLINYSSMVSMVFYTLPTRAWELMIGSWLAVSWDRVQAKTTDKQANVMAWIGFSLIIFGLIYLSPASIFPAWNALYPCIGAGLLIAFCHRSTLFKLFSWRPIVYVGLISYCLYLWHWPVIVYSGMYFHPDNKYIPLFVISVSLGLAIASRYLIEIPTRDGLRSYNTKSILIAGFAMVMLTSGAGLVTFNISNSSRYTPDILKITAFTEYKSTKENNYQFRRKQCMIGRGEGRGIAAFDEIDKSICFNIAPDRKNYLIIGDSHAAHLWRAMETTYPEVNFLQVTAGGCLPLLNGRGYDECRKLMNYAFNTIIPSKKLDGVIFMGRWHQTTLDQLNDSVSYTRKYVKNIALFGPTVEYHGVMPLLLARSLMLNDNSHIEAFFDHSKKDLDAQAYNLAQKQGIPYVSLYNLICPEQKCRYMTQDGAPYQFDYGHLTFPASLELVAQIKQQRVVPFLSN